MIRLIKHFGKGAVWQMYNIHNSSFLKLYAVFTSNFKIGLLQR